MSWSTDVTLANPEFLGGAGVGPRVGPYPRALNRVLPSNTMSADAASNPARPSMLVVEDDEALRARLARAFVSRGFDTRDAANTATALAMAEADPPEFVVLDLRMPDGSGLDLIGRIREVDPATRIVVLTGYGSIATALEAVRRGATHYLTKPASADEILAAFERDGTGEPVGTPSFQPMSLDRVEWEHVSRVLVECGGNVSEAARVLGIHRRSLQRKLSRYPSVR
jgi:two-component system, response regulator RegA